MKYLFVLFSLICTVSYADGNSYKLYLNKDLGISLEYPKSTEIEDVSNNYPKIWFHIGEWPKDVKYTDNKQPRSPISGVLLQQKSNMNIDEFINKERQSQEKGGYRNQVKENKFDLGNGITGIEFVRTVKPINKIMHYLVFHVNDSKSVLSLWHIESTGTGFMDYPELEAKALNVYKRMKNSLKIIRQTK
ncbi:MAG: hypothetical protein AB2603_14510 [Candidatus Thiodiazotropha endolucinida]